MIMTRTTETEISWRLTLLQLLSADVFSAASDTQADAHVHVTSSGRRTEFLCVTDRYVPPTNMFTS